MRYRQIKFGLVKKKQILVLMSEIEAKMPSISCLATTSALTAVENKITDYILSETERKIAVHNHDKYITTAEFNKFTSEILAARLAQANLITKTYFHAKLISLNKKGQLK